MQRRNLLKNIGILSGASLVPEFSKAQPISQIPKKVLRIAHITDVHVQPLIGAVKCFERCLHYIQKSK